MGTPESDSGSSIHPDLAASVETRLLDQCALDDALLLALGSENPAFASQRAKVKRRSALRRMARRVPFLDALERRFGRGARLAGRRHA